MTKNMQDSDTNLMISVIKKYYELGMNQEQIAKEEFISKSSVCRIIKKAVENGYVSFQIHYPVESLQKLEVEFHKYFDLDKVFITPSYTDDLEIRLKDTCKCALADLVKMVKPEDTLAVSWGSTMEQLACTAMSVIGTRKCAKVILACGSVAGNASSIYSSHVVKQLSHFFSAEGYLLPAPLVLDTEELARAIMQDSHIKFVMDMALESQIGVFSIGKPDFLSGVAANRSLFQREYEELIANGAVGYLNGRCYDMQGNSVSRAFALRTIGLDLPQIRSMQTRIGIAVGADKTNAIIGALRGKLVNRLYTDEQTAKEVIRAVQSLP